MTPNDESLAHLANCPDRKQQLAELFTQARPFLQQSLLEYIPGLLVWDGDSVLENLPLSSYTGPLDQQAFDAWALVIAFAVADERLKIGYAITGYLRPLMKAAIDADRICSKNNGSFESPLDHVMELAAVAYQPKMCRRLLQPSAATLEARLYGLCKRNTSNTRKKRDNRRRIMSEVSTEDLARGGAEFAEHREDMDMDGDGMHSHDQDAA